jgi:hypothetical protein
MRGGLRQLRSSGGACIDGIVAGREELAAIHYLRPRIGKRYRGERP